MPEIKKILSKQEETKKRTRNQLIVGTILIGLMLFSTIGYALNSDKTGSTIKKTTYNGIDFLRDGEYWQFSYNGQDFVTRYSPEEVKYIKVPINLKLNDYSGKPLYFVSDTQLDLEIARNLNTNVLRVQNACIEEKKCKEGLPLKDCSLDNIIIFEETQNETGSIYQNQKCVFITANYLNQTQYSDAFLFKILGI